MWRNARQADVDLELFGFSIIVRVNGLNVDVADHACVTAKECVELICSACVVSLAVCVNDHNHLVQVSNLRLLIMERINDPEIYKKEQRETQSFHQ